MSSVTALLTALATVISELDELPLEYRTTRALLERLDQYLENPEVNIPTLLLEGERSLQVLRGMLQHAVLRHRELS